jgi:hypothetical protein
MPLWRSLLCIAIIPGAFAGLSIGICTSRWTIPWWGTIGVGVGGWLVGFIVVALVGTIVASLARGRKAH